MLQVERTLRPKKSISKSLILQQPEPIEQDHTGKAKEHFQHLRQKLKVIHQAASPIPAPNESNQVQQPKRTDKKGKKFKQQKAHYQLEVSDTSSSITDESFDKDIKSEFFVAKENLKKLSRQTNQNKNTSFQTNSPLYQQGKNESQKNESQQGIENNQDLDKININFVKSLEHNMDCKNIQEFYEEGYLNIQIQSDDLQSFLRFEHEVQEMIHRSQQFVNNKQMHEGLQEELVNYELYQNKQRLEREVKQKEFIQRIMLQEQQKQNFLQRVKTKKIGDIANKFIDHHHLDIRNDPISQGHLSRRKQELQQ
ncbi:unnamed protein product [Paramecium sonneborni]|uniref:Uncharacterized protein n=1 Tax=Paramecium sonneborni TaxID=65129 RepID=A0A8S1KCL1_9CILI|nr:unnamed protein product [Paramecium sonneborni]